MFFSLTSPLENSQVSMNKFFSLTALLVTIGCASATAQTFYELRYVGPEDKEEYVGLMMHFDDQNCQMRIVNADMVAKDEVAKADYINEVEDKEDASDMGVMYYQPEDGSDMPFLIWTWQKDDASDLSEKPYVAFDIENPDGWFEADYFQEISIADMDEEYVGQFFGPAEPEWKMITQGMALLRQQGSDTQEDDDNATDDNTVADGAPTLHFIMAANTNVSDIGSACKVDLSNAQSEFRGIAHALGLNYSESIIAGNNYGRQNLFDTVDNLKASDNDIVVFIYSGHGFRFDDQKDYYPNLDLTATSYDNLADNYVALSDVYSVLKNKGARLCLVFSDCCNSKIGQNRPVVASNSLFSRNNTSFDKAKLQKLFLGSQGSVIASAAQPGEYSWCGMNGGFFMLSLIESLRNEISAFEDTDPNWDELVNNAIAAAAKKSEGNRACEKQNGMKFVQVKSVNL